MDGEYHTIGLFWAAVNSDRGNYTLEKSHQQVDTDRKGVYHLVVC